MRPSNPTPRQVKATGARQAHGHILHEDGGALYVHLHRESGLAHRHYVLRPWQVRALAILSSRPMLVVYVIALVTWGWMASQAARVPLLQQRIVQLEADAQRLDTLSATLAQLQARYEQVQRMLSAATQQQARAAARDSTVPPPATPAGLGGR
jgi:outer membrane murein-binding lipoprotein Lpp